LADGHALGRQGEGLARQYLEMCGYCCLESRFRRIGGEIDLVVERCDRVVFVEVKTRGPSALAPPEAWVDRRKLNRLRRTALIWLEQHPECRGLHLRFDVISVEFAGEGRGCRLRHLPNVG